MRKILFTFIIMFQFSTRMLAVEQIVISSNWYVQSSKGIEKEGDYWSQVGVECSNWYRTTVPNTVLAVLEDAGVYPNLYFGTNLKKVPGYIDGLWLIMPKDSPFRDPWWYRTEFDVPKGWEGKYITLHFDGINYEAEVWLNGKLVADKTQVRGMFRRFEFLASNYLRYGGKNALAVKIYPPGLLPDKNYKTKQIEATTGWDDHNPQPPDRNIGIWLPVYLRCQGPVILRHPYVESDLALPTMDFADLTVSTWVTNLSDKPVKAKLCGKIEEISFEQEIELSSGEKKEVLFKSSDFPSLKISNPRVWWPVNLGEQNLYTLTLTCVVDGIVSDEAGTRFGIRDARTELNNEDWRTYYINGEKILIRGGAWMTCDMLLRFTQKRYDALIRFAKEAGLNMLRSEGFSIRETDTFYDLCDEYGVMVTQQIFGRSILDEELAIACIEDMMLRIRNHPSLVHFLGHDETFPTPTLDQAYKDLIAKHRVRRTYQPHSGTFVVSSRKSTGGTRTGTRELWTYASPGHYYFRKNDGAWGFAQSGGIGGIIAPMTSIKEMLPPDQMWPALDTEAWSFHTVTQGGSYFRAIRDIMNICYGEAQNLEDFYRKMEAMNYNSARGMFEAYCRNKYSATGITTWKYNTAWPATVTWQYVDWYLRPTSAYYGAKKACEPLHIQYAYDDECIWVINSFRKRFENLRVMVEAFNLEAKTIWNKSKEGVEVAPDGKVNVFKVEVPESARKPMYFLRLTLVDSSGGIVSSNTYWLSSTPDIPGDTGVNLRGEFLIKQSSYADFTALNTLPKTKLVVESQEITQEDSIKDRVFKVRIKNIGNYIAFMVIPEAYPSDKPGYELPRVFWSDGGIILKPAEGIELIAKIPKDAIPEHATPVFGARGWNVEI
ncbi:MAG: hypothetical protein N3G21_09020 [Candidatus Hydrogenedentes bacterium]|nr:hypothetical protein [Candidatus Hydrogenedentota bacterium]